MRGLLKRDSKLDHCVEQDSFLHNLASHPLYVVCMGVGKEASTRAVQCGRTARLCECTGLQRELCGKDVWCRCCNKLKVQKVRQRCDRDRLKQSGRRSWGPLR